MSVKNCGDCPHYRNRLDTGEGIPMCGLRGIPLGMLTNEDTVDEMPTDKEIAERVAGACPQYQDKNPNYNLFDPEHGVFATPAQTPDVAISATPGAASKAMSCAGCIFSVNPADMVEAFGIPMTGCRKLGRVIGWSEGVSLANRCEDNEAKPAPRPTDPDVANALTLLPYLRPATSTSADPGGNPVDYPTDKPVTPEDEQAGIRAWRLVSTEGREIYAPIFRADFFSEEERGKIPQFGDDEHPELYQDHLGLEYKFTALWAMGETPALSGPAGVGKSEAYRYVAYRMQIPFERISITNSTELDDLAGRFVLEPMENGRGNQTRFEYGRLSKAWGKPCVVCLDEPNTGPPDVWQYIRPLTDNSKQMVLDMNRGERIERHRFAYLGMAMNPDWDIRNVGAHRISDADGSRLMHITVPPPSEKLERSILVRRCAADGYKIPRKVVREILASAKDLRALADGGDTISVSWGTRQTIKVARLSEFFDLLTAHRMAGIDMVSPEEQEVMVAAVKSNTTES